MAAAPLPAPSSVAPPPSRPRISLPGNFNAPAVTDAAPSSAEAEFTSAPEPAAPPAAASLTDLERGLQIFSSFDAEDFRPTKPAPVAAAVAAAPPPGEPVAEVPAPSAAARRTFTELELEGDSLLHAVETAASVGVEQRGEAASDGLEEPMEMPDDQKLPPGELPKIPLFSDLPPDAFIALCERCPLKRAEPGDVIIQQGSLGKGLPERDMMAHPSRNIL